MCKTCLKPIYGGADEGRWGSVISASQYDNPLDLSREKDTQRPLHPAQVKQTQQAPPPPHQTTSKQAPPIPTQTTPTQTQTPPHQLHEKPSASKLDTSAHTVNGRTEDIYEANTSISQHEVKPGRGEVGTLTEIHSQDNVAEVDLISLVEEQIPKYVLRADTLTDFGGYDNQDFARNAAQPPDADLDLSSELVEETLKYFILCSERRSQMTKTYHDIEAVTRLLEEKESDLELAARIGQGLLEKNRALTTKNEHLEELLGEAQEKISQLRHEVTMKDALLQMYREDVEHSASLSEEAPPVGLSDSDTLHKKVKQLEDENLKLKTKTEELTVATDSLEETEMQLVNDCVQQLDTANKQVRQLQEELSTKGEVCHKQQEENTGLLSKLISVESKYDKLVHENDDMRQQVVDLQTTQMELTQELGELEERYGECVSLLYEKQSELKSLHKKAAPSVIHQHYGTSPFFMPEGSLALELEKSQTEESCPEDYKAKNRRTHMSRVLETAKSVRRAIHRAESSASLASSTSMWSEEDSMRSSLCTTDIDSDTPSEVMSTSHLSGLGKPGVPGSNDLETALRRLTREEENNQINNSMQSALDRQREDDNTPTPCPTPDSFMSTGSTAASQQHYRIPEKLQIVKPLEGSLTLHQWQKLATPRLEGLLETRPGVQIRGDRNLELEEEVYSITDIEEDDDLAYLLAKSADDTAATFTYTTSKVMHPADHFSPPSRLGEVSEPAARPTTLPLQQHTPELHATSTFSMNQGLAEALQERDVQRGEGARQQEEEQNRGLMSLFSSWLRAPRRFRSLVTETPASSQQSHTSSVYSPAPMYVPPLPGVTSQPMPHRPEQAYLPLVDKMGELGPAGVLGIAEKTGISPLKQDPVDVGLNTMMFIRRNRIAANSGRSLAQTLLSGSEKGASPPPYHTGARVTPPPQRQGLKASTHQGSRPALSQQVRSRGGLKASPEQGVVKRGLLTKTLKGLSEIQPGGGGVLSRAALLQSPLHRAQASPTHSSASKQSFRSAPTTPNQSASSTPNKSASTPRPCSSTPNQSASTPRPSSCTPRPASSTPKQSGSAPGESLCTPGPSSLSLSSPGLPSSLSSPGPPSLSTPSPCGGDSSPPLHLPPGPVFHTCVAGLGYAVSPPSIHSVTTARDSVYMTCPSPGNVGTGTVHSPHKTPRHKAGVRSSAEAAIRRLGQGVRARESCEVIGGLTSTPFSKT